MSQEEILNALKEEQKKWVTVHILQKKLQINARTLNGQITKMIQFNEVEFFIDGKRRLIRYKRKEMI